MASLLALLPPCGLCIAPRPARVPVDAGQAVGISDVAARYAVSRCSQDFSLRYHFSSGHFGHAQKKNLRQTLPPGGAA